VLQPPRHVAVASQLQARDPRPPHSAHLHVPVESRVVVVDCIPYVLLGVTPTLETWLVPRVPQGSTPVLKRALALLVLMGHTPGLVHPRVRRVLLDIPAMGVSPLYVPVAISNLPLARHPAHSVQLHTRVLVPQLKYFVLKVPTRMPGQYLVRVARLVANVH
jgi:hypothetical protein